MNRRKHGTSLKELVSSESVLKFYDPNKPIKISTDARSALGAVFPQLHGENWCPVHMHQGQLQIMRAGMQLLNLRH